MRFFYLTLSMLVGCAGSLDNPEDFAFVLGEDGGTPPRTTLDASSGQDASSVDPATCATALFRAKCAGTICHDAEQAQVDLVSAGVESRLVDQPSESGLFCADRVLVATDGGESLLLDKVGGTPSCGSPMPFGGAALDNTELECLEAYVESLGGSVGGGL